MDSLLIRVTKNSGGWSKMSSKKTFALMLVMVLAFSVVLAACGSNNESSNSGANSGTNTGTNTDEGDQGREVFEYKFMNEYQNLPDENPTMKDKLIMEKFDIVTDTNYITLAEGLEKLSVLFASGNYPDVIPNLNHEAEVKKWGTAGFLISMTEHMDKLPEYRNRWSDEDWETVTQFASNPDGELYYLPAKNYRSHSKAWIYRKDI